MLFLFPENEENWCFGTVDFKQLRRKAQNLIFWGIAWALVGEYWLVFTPLSSSHSHKVQFWDGVCVSGSLWTFIEMYILRKTLILKPCGAHRNLFQDQEAEHL